MTTSLEKIRDEKAENYWVTVPSNDDNYYNGIDLDTSFKKGFDAALESLDCTKCKHLIYGEEIDGNMINTISCCSLFIIGKPEKTIGGCKKFEQKESV